MLQVALKVRKSLAGVIIMLNMVMIGVEAELSLHDPHVRWAAWVERAFLAVYAVELVLRLLAGGRKILHSSWFWLDFFLVAVGRCLRFSSWPDFLLFSAGVHHKSAAFTLVLAKNFADRKN